MIFKHFVWEGGKMLKVYDLLSLYKKALEQGFTKDSLSSISGVSVDILKQLESGENINLLEHATLGPLFSLLSGMYCQIPEDPEYLESLVDLVCDMFNISFSTIVAYLELDENQLKKFFDDPQNYEDSYEVSAKLWHFIRTILMDKKYL